MCQTTDLEDCVLLKTFNKAFDDFRKATPGAGAYFNEADFFENNWQDEFWGMENYSGYQSQREMIDQLLVV